MSLGIFDCHEALNHRSPYACSINGGDQNIVSLPVMIICIICIDDEVRKENPAKSFVRKNPANFKTF